MFKRFNKIKILGLITIFFLISCAEEEFLGPASFDNFTKFAAMNNYRSPLFNDTVLHLVDNGSIMSHDNTFQVYKYVEQFGNDNSRAIYNARLPRDLYDKFFIVHVVGTGKNKTLNFYLDGESSGGFYWSDKDDANLKYAIQDNISIYQLTFFELAPKTKYVYPKDDSYINLLQSGSIVYYHDESVMIFDYDSTPITFEKNRSVYKAEGDNYLGVEIIGIGDNKDIKFYFNKNNGKDDESLFWTNKAIHFDDDRSNANVFPKTFIDHAIKFGYKFALDDKGANIHYNGTIMNSTDTKELFTYHSQPDYNDSTQAVYQEVNSGKFVGIKVVGTTFDDKELEIYFKNNNGIAKFWDNKNDVKHVDNDVSMLATWLVRMEQNTPKVITADSSKLPTTDTKISTLIADNITYVLSQTGNNSLLSYTIGTSDNPAWDSSLNYNYKVVSSSLQSIGKYIFATVINGSGNVEVLKLRLGLSPLHSNDSSYINEDRDERAAPTGLVTVAANDIIYIASSNGSNTQMKKIIEGTISDVDSSYPLFNIKSATVGKNEIITAGLNGTTAKVFVTSFSGVSTDITGTGLPTTGGNISVVYAENNIYAAVTENSNTYIYVFNSSNRKWTKQRLPSITGIGAVEDIQLISEGESIYFLYRKDSKLVITPLRIKKGKYSGLALFGDGKNTSTQIDIHNTKVIAGVTIVDSSIKSDLVNAGNVLPTGYIYITYLSEDNKLEVVKINMKYKGVFPLPTIP